MKYIIINEALFNDATALVMFTIFLSTLVEDSYAPTYTVQRGIVYIVEVIFVSPLLGLAMGILSVAHMYLVLDKHNEEYTILRIVIPICCTFLTFIIANYMIKVSGVVSCIFSGELSIYRENE